VNGDGLAALEFPAIVERLVAATATPHGAELARELLPSADSEEVSRRQALTAEAVALLDISAEPPLDGIDDVRDPAALAARGGVLTPDALREIAATIGGGLRARAAVESEEELAPLLCEIATAVDRKLGPLAKKLDGLVEDDGSDLRDNASPLLRRLRKELRTGKDRVFEELRRLARTAGFREHLQEDFVTERGGRPVLALKASAPRSIRGVVHDASGSGQTLFVEPFEVVELTNRRSEAAAAERDEVERILRELSAAVGADAGRLTALVEATAAIDLAVACGIVSRRWHGTPVESSDDVRLLGARHPLLDPATAVPIDLDLGPLRALVISGPNTGGKTVALKTLGLAVLLHQSGLRPPAATAALPVFDQLLADIGDRQSIEMSLSTFSAHISNLVAILGTATERSLVLVDELASGTDPTEGAALAQAVLSALSARARLTVVTTHHAELKEWASATDGAANAATALDPATHLPLYRIALGRPGMSHALQTAERLGLDASIVADARGRVAPERLRIEELLAEAEAAERSATEARQAAERERAETQALNDRVRERSDALEDQIDAVRASAAEARELAVAEAERDLAAARAELSALREEIRVARKRERELRRATPAAAARAESDRDRHLDRASTRAERAERSLRTLAQPTQRGPLAVGDPVTEAAIGLRGTIAAIDGDEAEVVGARGQRVRIALARLRPDAHRSETPETATPAVQVIASARSDLSDELDVRGTRAHEAREVVRSFVDDAALAGLPQVRVIHGRGTGAVRTAVRDELDRHPLVERHESESVDGATVVYLGSA
jgi:DNA mismatch repair protein MutS2